MKRAVLAILLLALPGTIFARDFHSVPTVACAAFSRSGDLGAASFAGGSLTLHISSSSSAVYTLSRHSSLPAETCRAYFSTDTRLLAVVLHAGSGTSQRVEIDFADPATGKWLSSAPVVPHLPTLNRGFVAGFLGDTHNLVILNTGVYYKDTNSTTLFPVTLKFSSTGKPISWSTDILAAPGKFFNPNHGNVDTVHNRLWARTSAGDCGLRSATLVSVPGPALLVDGDRLRRAGCYFPDEIATSGRDTVVIGSRTTKTIRLWLVDPASGNLQQLSFPVTVPGGWYSFAGKMSVSPDGTVLAVPVTKITPGRYGKLNSSFQVAIVQLHPFRIAYILDTHSPTPASTVAVNYYNGKVYLALFLNGKWLNEVYSEPHFSEPR